jgi:secreted trypsin-like serine protease
VAPNVVRPFVLSKVLRNNQRDKLTFDSARPQNNEQVLSAAHCFSANQNIVTLGMHKINQDDRSEFYKIEHIPIAQSVVHPNYDDYTLDNDFWMIRLQWASKLYSGNIAQLDTPTDDLMLSTTSGAELVVFGFGTLTSGGVTPNVMQEVVVDYISNAACVKSPYGYSSSDITSTMMCAEQSGKDSCQVCIQLTSDACKWKHKFVRAHQPITLNPSTAGRLWRSST